MVPVDLTGHVYVRDRRPYFTGNYSSVFLGVYNKKEVAVKVIKAAPNTSLKAMRRKVERERVVWAALDHRNILPFYGYAEDAIFEPFGALISPWCRYGDTSMFFAKYGDELPIAQKIDLWKDAITGVDYLHSYKPLLIHGDIKPGNVLIADSHDGTVRAVLCDFGLVRIFLDEGNSGMTTTTAHTGTERYLAPELVNGDDLEYPTPASDVYALGCLGLEFVFGRKVYAHRKHNLRGCLIDDIASGMAPAERPEDVIDVAPRVWEAIQSCWNAVPGDRPTASRLLERLNEPDVVPTNA